MPRLADHPEGIRPLLSRGRRVVVDAHPICAACGRAVMPTGPDRWRHVPNGRTYHGRSRWLSPVPLRLVSQLRGYDDVTARYPWVASAVSRDEWDDARRRLETYATALTASRQRRRLRIGENPYLELLQILTARPLRPGVASVLDLPQRRRELAALFAWAVPSEEALATVARFGPILDGGAGMAYWTALLRLRGCDAIAYDLAPPSGQSRNEFHPAGHQPWTNVRTGSSVAAIRRHRDRTLLLCWPPYEDDAASYAALRVYRGDVLIYAGQEAAGSVRFHRELALNWSLVEQVDLPHWPHVPDRLLLYRRNAARRRHQVRDRCSECGRFITTGSIGRCDWCFERHPPALALRNGRHRAEYPPEAVERMPTALRRAFEQSPNRIA